MLKSIRRWKYLLLGLLLAGLGTAWPRLTHPTPTQPLAFPHALHLRAGLHCTDCHRYAAESASAGLPSVRECALCHARLRTQTPLVRKALAYAQRGIEIPWRRVYRYPASAHLRFPHNMHIAAGFACSTCHGDMRGVTTARLWKPLNMGVCITCHRQYGAKTECQNCHD